MKTDKTENKCQTPHFHFPTPAAEVRSSRAPVRMVNRCGADTSPLPAEFVKERFIKRAMRLLSLCPPPPPPLRPPPLSDRKER
jgi:hypothetical protein